MSETEIQSVSEAAGATTPATKPAAMPATTPAATNAPTTAATPVKPTPPASNALWSHLLHVLTPLTVEARVRGLTVRDLYRLEEGSIVAADLLVVSNVPIRAAGALIARGEFQVTGDHLAVRVAELA